MDKILELINVGKVFGKDENQTKVLQDINIEIKNGEFVAIVGPSGSGKTTLLQIAGLLEAPTSGTIKIKNTDASKITDEKRTNLRKNNIGFIYQFHHLLPEFTALENVAMPLLIKDIDKKTAFSTAEKILKELELENRMDHKPSELSGGQQQRVAIARAIVSKPSLILADEPTGNLDSELSKKIFSSLHQLVKEHKIACIMVTHNLELAKKADRIIEIKDGKIC